MDHANLIKLLKAESQGHVRLSPSITHKQKLNSRLSALPFFVLRLQQRYFLPLFLLIFQYFTAYRRTLAPFLMSLVTMLN
jgi:hypothetical protein